MRVFLSYATEQKSVAEPIAFSLRSRGHSVFLDKDDLPPGRSFDEQIQKAVEQSDVMIYLVSPTSVAKGRYTRTELEFARAAWRHPANRVLPVMIEPTPMEEIPSFLKGVTILEPQGNVTAEVAAAIELMNGHDFSLEYAAKGAAMAAFAMAILMTARLFAFPYYDSETTIGFLANTALTALLVGLPICALTYLFPIARSWKVLLPIVSMAAAFFIAQPYFLKSADVVSQVDIGELGYTESSDEPQETSETSAEPSSDTSEQPSSDSTDTTGSASSEDNEARIAIFKQLQKQNVLAQQVNTSVSMLIWGAIMSLGALLGLMPVAPNLQKPFRWFTAIGVGAAAAVIAAEIGLAVAQSSSDLGFITGFAIFYAALGAILGFWLPRKLTT